MIEIGSKVRFKYSSSKLTGIVIGIFEEDVLTDDNKHIIVYKGDFKVRMENHKEGSFTPAQKEELELVE